MLYPFFDCTILVIGVNDTRRIVDHLILLGAYPVCTRTRVRRTDKYIVTDDAELIRSKPKITCYTSQNVLAFPVCPTLFQHKYIGIIGITNQQELASIAKKVMLLGGKALACDNITNDIDFVITTPQRVPILSKRKNAKAYRIPVFSEHLLTNLDTTETSLTPVQSLLYDVGAELECICQGGWHVLLLEMYVTVELFRRLVEGGYCLAKGGTNNTLLCYEIKNDNTLTTYTERRHITYPTYRDVFVYSPECSFEIKTVPEDGVTRPLASQDITKDVQAACEHEHTFAIIITAETSAAAVLAALPTSSVSIASCTINNRRILIVGKHASAFTMLGEATNWSVTTKL